MRRFLCRRLWLLVPALLVGYADAGLERPRWRERPPGRVRLPVRSTDSDLRKPRSL
jgi:hypothetical protein